MADPQDRLARDRAVLESVADSGIGSKLSAYLKLSGPGWLQGAITLGGGSLAGGLYLGVLAGYGMMWLQPLAMALGVAMLASIAYVTLSTGRRPLQLVTREVNPVLGWGWAIATLMANVVWCLPQFSLGTAAVRQNILPGLLGPQAAGETGKVIVVAILGLIALATIISYERGGQGMKIFESILKVLVGVIVLCFVGVVIRLTFSEDGINWGMVLSNFIPSWDAVASAPRLIQEAADETGDAATFWIGLANSSRIDVFLTAAATAVGINMTFLLPNSLLDRGWDRQFRGLAIFDLSIGLFVPFLIATSCVVIASAAQFHGRYNQDLVVAQPVKTDLLEVASGKAVGSYLGLLDQRLIWEHGSDVVSQWKEEGEIAAQRASLSKADRKIAAILVKRDSDDLADALTPLTGREFAQWIFGTGVLAMAISTIIVLMLINGYVFSEVFNAPHRGMVHFIGTLLPLGFGAIAPFVWTDAMFWLAVPTSVFGMVLLPIAYVTFLLLINNSRVLGDAALSGSKRIWVNAILILAVALSTVGACTSISTKAGLNGFIAAGVFVLLAVIAGFAQSKRSTETGLPDSAES